MGEQPLPPWSSCVLGSINLANMVLEDWSGIDYPKFKTVIEHSTRFLDNIVTINEYPLEIIKVKHDEQRRIGLGVTGLADVLIMLGAPYGSEKGRAIADEIMTFINNISHEYSVALGLERGSFPLFEQSTWFGKVPAMRNAATTTIAPTGTLTTILGNEGYGAEPLFAPGYMRIVMDGTELPAMSELFITIAKREGFYSDELIRKVAKSGTANHPEVPAKWRKVFASANEISYKDHIAMQTALQNSVDSAISKTINMSSDATLDDVRNAYMLAYKSGNIKGLTIYRDGSRGSAPITAGTEKKGTEAESPAESKLVEPRPRPTTTSGITTQFKTGCGKMYLTVNSDDHGVCETFARTGSKGGCAGLTEGVSRLVSLALRSGIDPEHIVDQLCSVECKVSISKADALGKSCPDAIGKVLKEMMGIDNKRTSKQIKDLKLEEAMEAFKKDKVSSSGCEGCAMKTECKGEVAATADATPVEVDDKYKCPWCGSTLRTAEGCFVCDCGFSKCG
jgi:ribonucleoside-diphosphate reductase alpha chain